MPIPLAVLIVEDVESDAQFLVRQLKKADYELVYERVETAEQMCAALKDRAWDIVISDYSLPQFDGLAALNLLQGVGRDIPFIIVSGTIGEETAVAMMKAGAHDYLMKANLARLAPAVERELVQAVLRKERKQTDAALRESEARYRAVAQSANDAIISSDSAGNAISWNPGAERIFGYSAAEVIGLPLTMLMPSSFHDQHLAGMGRVQAGAEKRVIGKTVELQGQRKDGSKFPLELSLSEWQIADNRYYTAIMRDITERKEGERALGETYERYRAILQTAMDGFWLLDVQGRLLEVNETYCRMSGYSEQELLVMCVSDLEDVETADDTAAHIHKVMTQGEDRFESRHRRKDGSIFDVEVSVQYRSTEGGRLVVFVHNITERKLAELTVQESERFSRATVDALSAHIAILDGAGTILAVNRAWREFADANSSGTPSSKVCEGTNYLSVCETSSGPNSKEAAAIVDGIRTVMSGGQSEFLLEYPCHSPNEKRWFNARVTRFPGEGVLRIVVAHENITKRKLAEEELQASEIKYRNLVETTQELVWKCDGEGKFIYLNPAWEITHGYKVEEMLGRSFSEFQHPEVFERDVKEFTRHLSGGSVKGYETTHIAKDGTELTLLFNAIPLFDALGNVIGTQGTATDITMGKQAEKFMQLSGKRYRELFNSMIDGFALHEIICDEDGTPVDYRFLEVNPAYERLTGMKSENLIGRTALEAMPNTEPYWIEVFGNVALTGRSTFYENFSRELGRYFEISVYCPQTGQFAVILVDITERKQAEEGIRQHVAELEMLYQSGLALSQLLNPREIGQKILELLQEKLNLHHTRIRLYHPQDDTLELLDFNQPGLIGGMERREMVEHFQSLITHSSQGMSGWVVQHGQPLRSGDVSTDLRYIEAYPGIKSGLYIPMKLGERIVGVISIEDEFPDAFSETDERLIVTLANQAASAFENARLFEETRQRVMELETLNRISLVLRSVSKPREMLSIVLDEALAILNTSHGSISLYDEKTDTLEKTIARGWVAQVIEPPQHISEGIEGKVFTSGEIHISREFASDPETHSLSRGQMPPNWGGACLPIRTTQQTLGVMNVSVPSEREFNKDEIRLLSILSEMIGAALQRMQLHEQTIHRLEQLRALRAVDQAISSSLDMRLTLNVLLMHAISQLEMDAADVLLLHPDSNLLELMAGRGFHTLMLESVSLTDSFAGRTIIEHLPIMALDYETASQNPQLGKLWKKEGFVSYWCMPLIVKGEVKGVLEVYRRSAFTPDAGWLEFLEAMAGQAAIAIDNTQLFENLQRANLDLSLAYDATIEGWSRAMDLRDHETEGHTLRVTDLTLKLARAMRISESQLTSIRRGALLHDIGKMGVPDSILLKEGKLTDEEWVAMRKHPQLARDMLMPIDYLNDALDIPYCHHEKWDGTGYPQGLKGDHIPLVARIFAVVDVWDALTNDRSYRKKWTKSKARQYVKEQSGIHFDPLVVGIFLKTIDKK